MAVFAFESTIRNGEVVVPEDVVLPESAKVYIIFPEEEQLAVSSPIAEFEISESEQ